MPEPYDVIVLGAGAAGLMCAVEAGRRGRRVLVLDHADRVGRKILISGGGRCNFTNLHCSAANFLSENPGFAHSAVARFTPAEMIALVERHGIPYHEKTLGQLFCDRSARDIVMLLERECAQAGVRIELRAAVRGVRREGESFYVETDRALRSRAVVVATGGLSIPKMGATGVGYEIARQFDLRVVEPRPGLVPLTLAPADLEVWGELAGVSAEAVVAVRGPAGSVRRMQAPPAFREKVLLTHRGLSGPAILQASSYWRAGQEITLDLAPGRELFAELLQTRGPRDAAAVAARLRPLLSARWAEAWTAAELAGRAPGEPVSKLELTQLEQNLHAWTLRPAGTEGFAKAEVTVGGVDTAELDAKTMQARKAPGLFFIGEVVDVTGWLGGYNFQWAWASGAAAGRAC